MSPRTLPFLFALLSLFVFNCNRVEAQTTMGAIGDSLLDEYFEQEFFGINNGYAMNGLELMIATGRVDVGGTGNWGGTRQNGYEYNWALAGSTTGSLIANQQHTNLAQQVAAQGLANAVMVVGSNNLFPIPPTYGATGFPSSDYEVLYEGLATQADIDRIANQAIQDVVDAATALKASGVNVVVATAPDYGIAPFTQFFYTDPVKRERADDVTEYWNNLALQRLTQEVGVTVVDLYGLSKDIWGDNGSENETFELGGVELDLDGTGGIEFADLLTGNANPNDITSDTVDAFLHDGLHPNTAIGGIFANAYMTAFNLEYGGNFELFTEEEMLLFGGPNLGSMYTGETLQSSLGGKYYGDYVYSAVPEANPLWLLAFGVAAFFAVRFYRQRNRHAIVVTDRA